jgi:hypothetical protein
MRYSTYVLLQGLITGIVFLVFATVFLAIGGSAVIGLVALLAVLLGIGFGLSVAWAPSGGSELQRVALPRDTGSPGG